MPWEPWLRTEQRTLARYATPEAAKLLPQLPANPADLRADLDGKLKTLRLIYDTLCSGAIQYDRAPVSLEQGEQRIRQPIEIMRPPNQGTCLDLALLAAGVCLHYDLLPLLILIKGHALIAVSRLQYQRDLTFQSREELRAFSTGLLPAENGAILRSLIDNGQYAALECTGCAYTQALDTTLPEGRGRYSGRMPFERALDAGREQLDLAERPFLYALDIASLHPVRPPYPIDLPYERAEAPRQAEPLVSATAEPAQQPGTRTAEVQRQSLRRRLEHLEQEHTAVDQQLSTTLNAGDRLRLQRQLEAIAQEMQQVEAKLQKLVTHT